MNVQSVAAHAYRLGVHACIAKPLNFDASIGVAEQFAPGRRAFNEMPG